MPLFDVFKKKKSIPKISSVRSGAGKIKKENKKMDVFKKKGEPKLKILKPKKGVDQMNRSKLVASSRSSSSLIKQAYKTLKNPHITEKATNLAKENQYVFKVLKGANKTEIKKAIKNLYKVDVQTVRIINIPPHKIRLGRIEGWKKGYKKAIIKIKEGQKIEILSR